MNIADIRNDYKQKSLHKKDVAQNPVSQFDTWFKEAMQSGIEEVNAMTLATCSNTGIPNARIVLLKEFSEKGFVFFTNYASQKGNELAENPRAVLLFFWPALERQVRISGLVQKIPGADSDLYFNSRPFESRVGAIASPQSQVIESREWLEQKVKEITAVANKENICRPDHWGGYIVQPVTLEFWQGRPGRLHDRLLYSLETGGNWSIIRLAP
jgi:pyridoxamine 5'-phosphate oxidase